MLNLEQQGICTNKEAMETSSAAENSILRRIAFISGKLPSDPNVAARIAIYNRALFNSRLISAVAAESTSKAVVGGRWRIWSLRKYSTHSKFMVALAYGRLYQAHPLNSHKAKK